MTSPRRCSSDILPFSPKPRKPPRPSGCGIDNVLIKHLDILNRRRCQGLGNRVPTFTIQA